MPVTPFLLVHGRCGGRRRAVARTARTALAAFAVTLVGAACGDGGLVPTGPTAPAGLPVRVAPRVGKPGAALYPVTSSATTPSAVTLRQGSSAVLEVDPDQGIHPTDETGAKPIKIRWTSENPNVVAITTGLVPGEDGLGGERVVITVIGPGPAAVTLRAYDDDTGELIGIVIVTVPE